ncbi:MAG: phage tail protein [Nitrincola lacisaponensis]|uniref:phage tail-collar fiber domain-containing protein n=1 Tax=Nitrincola lacisaponensis TaxID=267850 RepID=UPI003919C2A4
MALQITITDAGRAEVINADNTGTGPVTITEVGLGTGQYNPDPEQLTLTAETKRLNTIAGQVVSADIIHVTIKDETGDAYTVNEFGLYTDSGTLFAVYSDPDNPIAQKAAASALLLAVDIILGTLNANSLTFGDTSFAMPPASETVMGVVQKATTAEAISGVADKFPDAAGVKAHVDSRGTANPTDPTNGRFLRVGDFGTTNFVIPPQTVDIKTLNKVGKYWVNSTSQGLPIPNGGFIEVTGALSSNANILFQEYSPASATSSIRRFILEKNISTGEWKQPVELFHTGNLDPNSIVPVGTVLLYLGTAAPVGFVKLNGADGLSRNSYSKLYNHAISIGLMAASEAEKQYWQFGPGNGSTTFSLPDHRGEHIRLFDDGRGIDVGRVLGSNQDHQVGEIGIPATANNSSSMIHVVGSPNLARGDNGTNIADIIFNAGKEPRIRNVALLACIKY